MNRLKNILSWTAIIIVIILASINIYISLFVNGEKHSELDKNIVNTNLRIDDVIKKINSIEVKDGHTPVKGIDYNDGTDGRDGADGKDGANGEDGKNGIDGVDGKNGVDGKDAYIDIRCNANKNRWEAKYDPEDNWQILSNKSIKCTVD